MKRTLSIAFALALAGATVLSGCDRDQNRAGTGATSGSQSGTASGSAGGSAGGSASGSAGQSSTEQPKRGTSPSPTTPPGK